MFYWFYGCHCILLTNYTEIIEDIKILKSTNEDIIEKIKLMEEESLYESDEDSDSIVETEFTNSVVSNPKIEVKKTRIQMKSINVDNVILFVKQMWKASS